MASVGLGPVSAPRLRLQGWPLFGLLAATLLAAELRLVTALDWSNPGDIAWLMGVNWRLAAPCFLLTFTVSPLLVLFPSRTTRWLASNRRYFGLAFAVVALCQLLPIATFAIRYPPTLAKIHSDSSQFGEDVIYLILVLMTVTSFQATNRYLSRTTWRRLHATGLYLLAGLYTVSYVYLTLNEPNAISVSLGVGFVLAWGLRGAVWWRRRSDLHGWRFFWALFGATNGLMLASWSYFGVESAAGLHLVLSIATVLASILFLISLSAGWLERTIPGGLTARLRAERDSFFVAATFPLGWYIAFALATRAPLALSHTRALPLPLLTMIGIGIVALAALALIARDLARGYQSFAKARPLAHGLIVALLAVGLVLAR